MTVLRLSSQQATLLLSSIWRQALSPKNTPQNYEAIAHTYSLLLLFLGSKVLNFCSCHLSCAYCLWVAENCYSSCNLFDLIIFLLKWWYLYCHAWSLSYGLLLSLFFLSSPHLLILSYMMLFWNGHHWEHYSLCFFSLFALPDINFWGSCSQFSDCIFFNEPFTWRNRWSNLSFA